MTEQSELLEKVKEILSEDYSERKHHDVFLKTKKIYDVFGLDFKISHVPLDERKKLTFQPVKKFINEKYNDSISTNFTCQDSSYNTKIAFFQFINCISECGLIKHFINICIFYSFFNIFYIFRNII